MSEKTKQKKHSTKQKKVTATKKASISTYKKKIDELQLELESLRNKNIRLLAEFDNYKRRTSNEKNNLIKYSGEKLVLDILNPLDDLKRIMDSDTTLDSKSLIEGIILVYKKFQDNLNNNEIYLFNSKGDSFNPDLHEAIMSEKGKKDNVVMEEYESGYKYHERVIRHAKVVVSKKNI